MTDPAFHFFQRLTHLRAVESTWLLRVHQYGWKEASRMQDEDESIDTTFIEIDPEDGRINTPSSECRP